MRRWSGRSSLFSWRWNMRVWSTRRSCATCRRLRERGRARRRDPGVGGQLQCRLTQERRNLFDKMGLPGGKKGKNGAYGTGADVLEGLEARVSSLRKRFSTTARSPSSDKAYTDSLVEDIHRRRGAYHIYSMVGAATGRLSSTIRTCRTFPSGPRRPEDPHRLRG